MFLPAKFVMGFLVFWLIGAMWCNIGLGNQAFTENESAVVENMTSYNTISSSDQTNGSNIFWQASPGFYVGLGKAIIFDWPVFKNLDGTPNDFTIIRYVLLLIAAVCVLQLAFQAVQTVASSASAIGSILGKYL